jgi:DNA-binding CsgD family transcriptional regulator
MRGQVANEQLERLVHLEEYERLLRVFTPKQLVVVALRLDGLKLVEIAEILGVSRMQIWQRLMGARRRLLRAWPDLEADAQSRLMDRGWRDRDGSPLARPTEKQRQVLATMAELEAEGALVCPVAIARRSGVGETSIGGHLRSLERRGLVRRGEWSNRRRIYHLVRREG